MSQVFKLLVYAIVFIGLIYLISTFFVFPNNPITDLKKELKLAETNLGVFNSKKIMFSKPISFNSKTFNSVNTLVSFECNSVKKCDPTKIQVDFNFVKIKEKQEILTSFRCVKNHDFKNCKIFFGKEPAQINIVKTNLNNSKINLDEEKPVLEFSYSNIGSIDANNCIALINLKKEDFENNHKTKINYLNEEINLGIVNVEEQKQFKKELNILDEGKYFLNLKLFCSNAGFSEKTINFTTTKSIASTNCEATNLGEVYALGEKNYVECYCNNCNYAFECQQKCNAKYSNYSFEMNSKQKAISETTQEPTQTTVCGNGKIESNEECETNKDCKNNQKCENCKCVENETLSNNCEVVEGQELSFITSKPCITAEGIDAILKKYNSPAQGIGQYAYKLGEEYQIDPAIALAFFKHESLFGTLGKARKTKSWGNIRYHNFCFGSSFGGNCVYCNGVYNDPVEGEFVGNYKGFCIYSSFKESLRDWFRLLKYGSSYFRAGRTTVEKVLPKYAPSTENDTLNYINFVRKYTKKFREAYPNN